MSYIMRYNEILLIFRKNPRAVAYQKASERKASKLPGFIAPKAAFEALCFWLLASFEPCEGQRDEKNWRELEVMQDLNREVNEWEEGNVNNCFYSAKSGV